MLINAKQTRVVSSLGWADHASLWIYDVSAEKADVFPLSDARWISLAEGTEDYFAVIHHYGPGNIDISLHHFDQIERPIASINVRAAEGPISGDGRRWRMVPSVYINTDSLVRLFPERGTFQQQKLSWFDDSYDKGYQGILNVIPIPKSNQVIIPVQRDSSPVIYDPDADKVVGKLTLSNRHGNPNLRFRKKRKELWASDYDTLLRIDPDDWRIITSLQLQKTVAGR